MKYYIARQSQTTGRIEYKLKCSGWNWCDHKYLELHPDRVWKYTKQGATNYCRRNNWFIDKDGVKHTDSSWDFKYYIVCAE